MSLSIRPANLDSPEFAALIDTHAALMLSQSPPGSCHFLPMEGLRRADVTVWELRDGEVLIGCGGLRDMAGGEGEIKCMHTLAARRGEGLGQMMLLHILAEAEARGYRALRRGVFMRRMALANAAPLVTTRKTHTACS